MAWVWIAENMTPLTGVEARGYEDDEFDEVSDWYDAQFATEDPGILKRSDLFRHYERVPAQFRDQFPLAPAEAEGEAEGAEEGSE